MMFGQRSASACRTVGTMGSVGIQPQVMLSPKTRTFLTPVVLGDRAALESRPLTTPTISPIRGFARFIASCLFGTRRDRAG